MRYQIAFDPQLDLTSAEFVDAWNASEHAADSPASLPAAGDATAEPTRAFLPIEITVALITAATVIPTTVIATFVSDYLRHKFIDSAPSVTVTTIETPDGQPVLVITRREE